MGLLDMLAEMMKCDYLSDLRYMEKPNSKLHWAVASLPLAYFCDREWIDAAVYLCGIKCSEPATAKDAILNYF